MNLHRYKVKLPSPNSADSKYHFVGTWIGFAGMFAFVFHLSILSDPKAASAAASISIGGVYCLYWFSTQHKIMLYVLSYISFLVYLFLFAFWLQTLIRETSQETTTIYIYMLYFCSVFLVSAFYIRHLSKHNA